MTRLGIVINPTAGRDRGRIRGHEVVALLTQRGHQLVNLSGSSVEQATEHARQALVAVSYTHLTLPTNREV